jgi:hypothetical protein
MARKPPIIANGRNTGAVDIDELIAKTKVIRRGGTPCWAKALDGKVKQYLDRLRAMFERGEHFNLEEALKQAQQVFGVQIKTTAFRKHISGRCGCNDQKRTER